MTLPGPQITYLFRVPYYDFFMHVLKKAGFLGKRYTLHLYMLKLSKPKP